MVSVTKVSLTLNQIIGADLFLGYHVSNWNPRINYFLIGRYRYSNIFNVNYSYSLIKKFSSIILDLLNKKGRIWLVNENFSLFSKSKELVKLSQFFEELFFYNDRWPKGLLSNFKYVIFSEPKKFPHAIFVPNLQNNHFVVNEGYLTNIPSFSVIDSVDNPLNVFLPLPGNSKSINSLYFFYLFISKLVLHSRYTASSSFLFSLYNKAAARASNTRRVCINSSKRFKKCLFNIKTRRLKKSLKKKPIFTKSIYTKKTPLYTLRFLFFKSYLKTVMKPFLLSEMAIILNTSVNRNRFRPYSNVQVDKKWLKFSIFRWGLVFILFVDYFTNIFKSAFLSRSFKTPKKYKVFPGVVKTLLLSIM